jgi:hypothetical protein
MPLELILLDYNTPSIDEMPLVVPANAGTHNHRRPSLQTSLATAQKREATAYGSRRSPGRR